LYRFRAIAVLLDVKDIPQVGLLQWGWITLLYAASDFDLPEAVDPLQAYAEESGLLDEIGQDGVQAILAVAFSKVNHAH
jgi:hypothetical protein